MGPPAANAVDPDGDSTPFAVTVASPPPWLDARPGAADPGDSDFAAQVPGQIGRYQLKQQLGEGGLGTVHEAWDPVLSRTVAVKTLQFTARLSDRTALDRLFLNEARAVASLKHPHIVTVHDAGLSAHGVYIAMERLVGRDLRQALASGWRPTPPQAAHLMRRVADALAYAHARGVVHCDIKPANIFLTRRDRPTVLDFGIARLTHGAQAGASQANDGVVAGSPHYLAPEQLQGGSIDQQTDVYALGVVLYELLAGRKAFEGESLDQIVTAVMHGNPAPAHEVRTDVPPGLAAVAARAMARDPAQRHRSAAELSQALRPWQSRGPQDEAAADAAAGRSSALKPGWRRPMLLAAAVAALAGVAGLATVLERTPPPTPAPDAGLGPGAVAPPAAVSVSPPSGAPALGAEAAAPTATDLSVTRKAPRAKRVASATPPVVAAPTAVAAPPMGVLRLAVSPWGEIEVDGRAAGVTPPLVRLELGAGTHEITIRNGDFPPYVTRVKVDADQTLLIRHRFGT